MEIIKVSSTSVPNHVAGAIASLMREQDKLMIQTIGAAALNQAIKSIAIARGYIIRAYLYSFFSWFNGRW